MRNEFYSNCFIEMLKAKLRNPAVKVMYLPAFLNEVPCPHWMWLDDDGEHDFHLNGRLPWWKWFWHKGRIRTVHRGCYKGCIDQMIEKKYYSYDVAPVVRCKGCKHLVAVNVNGKGIPTCRVSGMEVAPDEFCSRGESWNRRADNG